MDRYIPARACWWLTAPTPHKDQRIAPLLLSHLRCLLPCGGTVGYRSSWRCFCRFSSSDRLKILSVLCLAVSSSIISALAFFWSGYSFLFSADRAAYSCFRDWIEGSFFSPRLSKYRFAASQEIIALACWA